MCPYDTIDFKSKTWTCVFCLSRNGFPQNYSENISESCLPCELLYKTVEYLLPDVFENQAFLFLIDLTFPEEELNEIKDSIQQVLNLLPEDSLVGLITYSRMVYIHVLGSSEISRCQVFDGSKEYSVQNIQDQLGLLTRIDKKDASSPSKIVRKYLMPYKDCEFTLNSLLDDLQPDTWPVEKGKRPLRCHSSAIQVGLALLHSSMVKGCRINLFAAGPSTTGPGQIISDNISEPIRSHVDILKGNSNASYMNKAIKIYESQANFASLQNIIIDMFFLSLDQTGLFEMKSLSELTGGQILLADSAKNAIFKKSYAKMFEKDENGNMKFASFGILTVIPSKQLKICGAIGHCTSANKKNPAYVSEVVIGCGNTNSWKLGGFSPSSTYAIYFDIVNTNTPLSGFHVHFQFMTKYLHSSGHMRLRITTVERTMLSNEDLRELCRGFDQEASAVLMSRYSILKTYTEEIIDVVRWIDKMLIKLVAKFAEYKKNIPSTFKLAKNFSLYPQFMYHLRRGNLLQTFNETPDETALYRNLFLKETTVNSLLMIQPVLYQYTGENPESASIMLEMTNLKATSVLLLDMFTHVLIWHGETVVKWRDDKLHEKEEYANIKQMLEKPVEDAESIIEERFPVPKFIICDQGDSYGQERLLKNRVIPNANPGSSQSLDFKSDDVPLSQFSQQLINLAVSNQET